MSVTILIYCQNEAAFIDQLILSLKETGLLEITTEVIFIDDESTDRTWDILQARSQDKIRALRLEPRQGKIKARLEAAESAKGERLLMLSPQVIPAAGFTLHFQRALNKRGTFISHGEYDRSQDDLYSLYWRRFSEIARATKSDADLILCDKNQFKEACSRLLSQNSSLCEADLLDDLVEYGPVQTESGLRLIWRPKLGFKSVVLKAYTCGKEMSLQMISHPLRKSSLVSYTLFFGIALWFGFSLHRPIDGIFVLLLVCFLIGLSTFSFAKNWQYGLRLMPVHIIGSLSLVAGALYGLFSNTFKGFRLRNKHKYINNV